MAWEDMDLPAPEEYPSKELHIISNTHWDREWVYPSAETRLLLLEFMDNMAGPSGRAARIPLVHDGQSDPVRAGLP